MLELGGRKLRAIKTSTVAHDVWMMARVADAGIRQVTMLPGETPEAFATRLTGELASSGQVLNLLGGILIFEDREDLDWTPAMAAETAAFLGSLTEPADKQMVLSQVASLVAGFFEAGLTSFTTSPSYSGSAAGGQPASNQISPTVAH